MARDDAGRVHQYDEKSGRRPRSDYATTGEHAYAYRHTCGKCGATRQDRQLGLEPTPEEYVANMVAVFREVRRVLRRDGTVWLNVGDSYISNASAQVPDTARAASGKQSHLQGTAVRPPMVEGLKPKDLVGIPWMLARALQEPYYTGRIRRERDRVWLAATLDAEGTICGFSHDRKDDGRNRTGLIFNITNSSPALLAEAARIWPTSISRHQKPSDGHLGQREVWRWHVNGIENKTMLVRELYPYLIVKRQQAVLAYNLLLLMADAKRLGHSPQRDAVRQKRAVIVGLLSDANQGRPFVMPSWCVEPESMYESGWYLRSDVVWSKPNPMPESVTDRPTKAHEYVFLLSREARYFYDADAVREAALPASLERYKYADGNTRINKGGAYREKWNEGDKYIGVPTVPDNPAGRNLRSVWTIATQPYPGAHFATFPQALVEPCVKAGTSERGVCPACGSPWRRVVERGRVLSTGGSTNGARASNMATVSPLGQDPTRSAYNTGAFVEREHVTTGWQPTCAHDAEPVPATVLDPFAGSGTTALVANRLSRRAILVDLSADYLGQVMERNRQAPLGLVG